MDNLKAKLFLLGIALVWFLLIVGTWRGWYQTIITLLAIPFKGLRGYRYSLWIQQDQDVNTIFKGNPDVTVSSKLGYLSEQGSKTATLMARVVDKMFLIAVGQEDHCRSSIERDEVHYTFKK